MYGKFKEWIGQLLVVKNEVIRELFPMRSVPQSEVPMGRFFMHNGSHSWWSPTEPETAIRVASGYDQPSKITYIYVQATGNIQIRTIGLQKNSG